MTVGGLDEKKIKERTRKGLEAARGGRGARPVADRPSLKQRIVEMRESGMTLQAIADTLNDARPDRARRCRSGGRRACRPRPATSGPTAAAAGAPERGRYVNPQRDGRVSPDYQDFSCQQGATGNDRNIRSRCHQLRSVPAAATSRMWQGNRAQAPVGKRRRTDSPHRPAAHRGPQPRAVRSGRAPRRARAGRRACGDTSRRRGMTTDGGVASAATAVAGAHGGSGHADSSGAARWLSLRGLRRVAFLCALCG